MRRFPGRCGERRRRGATIFGHPCWPVGGGARARRWPRFVTRLLKLATAEDSDGGAAESTQGKEKHSHEWLFHRRHAAC